MVRVVQLNINGLRTKATRLLQLLIKLKADIIIIYELKKSSFNRNTKLPDLYGYSLYAESLRAGIYYKTKLKKFITPYKIHRNADEESEFYYTAIKYKFQRQQAVFVSCYRTPNPKKDKSKLIFQGNLRNRSET